MSFRFQFRRGTTAERNASNPILAAGEPAVVLDSGQPAELVLGDGVTAMADLRAAVWDDDARLALAGTATQPGDLGTAAAADATDFATAAQGGLAGTAVQPAALRMTSPDTRTVDVDVNEAIGVIGQTPVGITTYAGDGAIVHPSVLFFPQRWNGWRYWMAYTPLKNGDSQYENPSIAVSDDGETWTVPAGLTNPVEPDPGGGAWNADPCLCMTADGATMLLVWKHAAFTKTTYLRTSTDGVTWTAKVALFANAFEDASPALLWDGTQYVMWTVKHADTPNTLYRRTAPAPVGPWSAPVACTVTLPAGFELWHIDIKKSGQQYHALVATLDEATAFGDRLFFGKSNDGMVWTFGANQTIQTMANNQSQFYKGCILPKVTPDGLAFDCWFTARGNYALMKTTITFDRTARRRAMNADITAAMFGLAVAADSFDRTDTTAGLGTSTSGHVWSNVLGNDMGITGGKAYLPIAANSRSIINVGVSDFRTGITFTTLGTTGWLLFRYADTTNLWRIGQQSGGLFLQKIVAGSLTSITTDLVVRTGDRIEVQCRGADIRVILNGRQVYQLTDAAVSTGTSVGINVDNIASRFDNLTVASL